MVVEVAFLTAKVGEENQLRDGMLVARKVLARAPGYLSSAFHKGIEDPRSFVLRVEWKTVEAHTSFRETPEFQDWRRPFFQHVDGAPMAGHYEVFTTGD